MSTPLRPQFFCSRPNGTLTPLIAVDELPPTLSIRGVSRVLTHGDTQGMTSLGTVSPRGQVYVVDTVSPTRTPAAGGRRGRGDAELQSSLSRIISDESIPANQRLALQTLVHQGMPQTWGAPTTPANGWMVPNGGATGHKVSREAAPT